MKIHARSPNYPIAVLCGENRVVAKAWDRDNVTCLRCLRILSRRNK